MSDFQPYPNTGKLTKNTQKTEDKHPDTRGEIFVTRDLLELLMKEPGDLVEIKLAAWTKISKAGNKYLSIQVSAPYKKEAKPEPKNEEEDDQDIPF